MATPDDTPIDLDGQLAELDAHLEATWRREERAAMRAARRLPVLVVMAVLAVLAVPLLLAVSAWAAFGAFVVVVACVQDGYRPARDRLAAFARSRTGPFWVEPRR